MSIVDKNFVAYFYFLKYLSFDEIKEKRIEEQINFYMEEVGDPFIIMQLKKLALRQNMRKDEKNIDR